MRAETLTSAADLARIMPAWWDLFARIPDLPPFVAPAWLIPWWAAFEPGRLASVAVWDGGSLVALAPLYLENGAHGRRLLPLGIGISDSLDVLLDPAAPEASAVLADAIVPGRSDWDLWSAEDARPGAAVLGLPTPPCFDTRVEPQHASPVLALPVAQSLETVIPAGKRRKWRMARHRAARRDILLRDATPDTLADDLDHLFRLHGARWQSRGESGVLLEPRLANFHRAAAPTLLAAGLLTLVTLTIDGAVAGSYYGFTRPGAAYAYLGGFDPAFAFESPGTLLIGASIERAAAEGATAFHFLRGREAYKYEWGARDMHTQRRTFVPRR